MKRKYLFYHSSLQKRTIANGMISGLMIFAFITALGACSSNKSPSKKQSNKEMEAVKGTFGYDTEFLKKYTDVVVLSGRDSAGSVLVTPKMQGRVMTSTLQGKQGKSLGWVNHDLIESGEIKEHFTPYGGEDRFWLGPEGGQYSVFLKPGKEMVFDNWYVPAGFNTELWTLEDQSANSVTVTKQLKLKNYSESTFDIGVTRTIQLYDKEEIKSTLNIPIPDSIKLVGYVSKNTIKNIGSQAWTKESGTVSVWILSQFNPAPGITVAISYKEGSDAKLGPKVNTAYFGKISGDRLKAQDGIIYFKIDGKKRGKLGVSPRRSLGIEGSYDESNQILTIMTYNQPETNTEYMNQLWEHQKNPYQGNAEFAYNDGPLEDGSQLGPFFEMESSSPAAFLSPDDSLTHEHRVFHFSGSERLLNPISQKLLGVSLEEIKAAF